MLQFNNWIAMQQATEPNTFPWIWLIVIAILLISIFLVLQRRKQAPAVSQETGDSDATVDQASDIISPRLGRDVCVKRKRSHLIIENRAI